MSKGKKLKKSHNGEEWRWYLLVLAMTVVVALVAKLSLWRITLPMGGMKIIVNCAMLCLPLVFVGVDVVLDGRYAGALQWAWRTIPVACVIVAPFKRTVAPLVCIVICIGVASKALVWYFIYQKQRKSWYSFVLRAWTSSMAGSLAVLLQLPVVVEPSYATGTANVVRASLVCMAAYSFIYLMLEATYSSMRTGYK